MLGFRMERKQFTDYSLRTLIFAAVKEGELTSIGEIARSFDISNHHLVKVVHLLAQLGNLETIRGRSGSIRLAAPPENRAVATAALVECLPPRTCQCRITGICLLKSALIRAREAFFRELDSVSLADIAGNPEKMKSRPGL